MIKLGITGGIASGKSMVTKILSTMGIPSYLTDDRAKVLMKQSPDIKRKLIELLGEEVYIGGELNKKVLANFLFASNENATLINNIVHPVVKEDFIAWVKMHEDYPLVVMECAILIEANFIDAVDVSVLVYAPLDVRIERAIKRDASTRNLIEQRIKAQYPESKKIKHVDYLIENDGESLLLPQVYKLLEDLDIN